MAWLHTWTGLLAGWLLFFVFLTGSTGYFYFEIDRWMRPELPLAGREARDPAAMAARAQAYLQSQMPHANQWGIYLPVERTIPELLVIAREGSGASQRVLRTVLDPGTGRPAENRQARATGGGPVLYRMHYLLHYLPRDIGIWIVGACTMFMLVALVSGVITHRRIFADFFTFRPRKGARSWLDAHNVASVLALPFFFMITVSGLAFFMYQYLPAGLLAAYGPGPQARQQYSRDMSDRPSATQAGPAAPLVPLGALVQAAQARWGDGRVVASLLVQRPNGAGAQVQARARREGGRSFSFESLYFDGATGAALAATNPSRTRDAHDALIGLHEGRFAGTGLRWLYFLSSLLGCAMIATGLVLWTAKRRARHQALVCAGGRAPLGFRIVEGLNIGTLAGLPLAIAAYFWANRLLPAAWPMRANWEVHILFLAWACALAWPALRPARRAWRELLWLDAAAYALLPALNAATTRRHLGITLPAGDWALAGVDLTLLAAGLAFGWAAWRAGSMRARGSGRLPGTGTRA